MIRPDTLLAVIVGAILLGSTSTPPTQGTGYRDRDIMANGARLYVADWGGTGHVLLFMPGFGNGAHIFDSIAPAFVDRFHVAALTPRGFPPSSAPDSGYTIAQLAADVRVVLDSLGGQQAVLVGHSISGAVITRFVEDNPSRLLAAVYLDGAYDFGSAYRRSREPKPITGPPSSVDTTAGTYRAWKQRYPDHDAVRDRDAQMWDIDSIDLARRQALVMALANEVRSTPHEVWRARAPALVVCAVGTMEQAFGWLTPDSARWRLAFELVQRVRVTKRKVCEDARRQLPHGRLLILEGGHYIFLDDREAVIRGMRTFLASITEHPD